MTYKEEIFAAMKMLGQDPRTIFIGQCVEHSGTAMFHTLKDVPLEQRVELPVFENTQTGIAIGLSLAGFVPVSIYPRMDFLISAYDQLANHLDKIGEMSDGQFNPHVIVRTAIGSVNPLFPGPQHCNNYSDAFRASLRNVDVVELKRSLEVVPAYRKALESGRSTILVEFPDLYDAE